MAGTALIALLHGPDQPGLVARTAGWIFQRGGNILHADQHSDLQAGVFFQRIEWETPHPQDEEIQGFQAHAAQLGMQVQVAPAQQPTRVAIFVSRIPHCFLDLLLRWEQGEFCGQIACVISNHLDLRAAAEGRGLPFYHLPVTPENKEAVEARQCAILQEHGAQLVVLARYMQVLSPAMLSRCGMPVINIHHSFLPAFAGARPYHHAHARGVKLIGATAHYATADLDEGPIIQQDVARVSHRHDINGLMRIGRDLEKSVLAQAVRWHLEHRVLVYNNRTIVFD